ncbi:MAG TPA: chromosome segregation protein SMC [Acidimicrobiales bacterium]|jgi:chromosome segregation protein|nr:chromosome segregation protein SMC [Acidimicrobiales bacterium]
MFLKSLSMKGFKSFADPTVLEFEPGITVVVGPNGSGKSNVVDAVTWVLGAQGPRSLRSAKMEDVIFAGTSSRPQLGRAEVSLTIDNSSGKLPVDLSEVTITRTLFRSGDSEYAINGAPCRLLDIQELLGDSGVGRQQHMIIGQGQLDTVLNARPEDRRAIIEEAAGVLKHRRRRERAERRLAATAENLERLGDLVREVRRQIRPLERQAAAARSHDAVASELLAVRRYLAGTEMAELSARRLAAAQNLGVCRDEERELHAALEQLDAEASSTTAELSSRREEDLANALGRVQGLVERARGLRGVLRERGRGVLAALDAAADVDVVSTLEAEGARLAGELATAEAEDEAGGAPERAELAAALAALDDEDAALRERWAGVLGGDDPDQAMARTRGRRELITRAAAREQQDLDGLGARVATLEQRQAGAAVRADLLAREASELDGTVAALDAALAAATEELESATRAAEAAQAAADEAADAGHRSEARAEALERALGELQGAGGRELLREVDGVVGSLVDLVEIDPGWEAAFEAAAGAGVAAVVVDGRRSAQAALSTLRERGVTGAVLAPRPQNNGAAGGGAGGGPGQLPPGTSAQPVRAHVRARHGGAVAESVLDTLVGRAVRVDGWEEAIDLSLARDDLVVVTPEGDRFAATGWRVRSGTGVVTKVAVEEAQGRAREAAAAAALTKAHLTEARIASSRARDARAAAERANDRHGTAGEAKRADVARAAEEQARLAAEIGDARAAVVEAQRRLADVTAEEAQLDRALPDLTEALSAWRELQERRSEVLRRRQELEVRVAGVLERRRVLAERQAEVERRLAGHAEERASAAARRERLEAEGTALRRLEALVETEHERLDRVFDELRHDYQDQIDAVRAGGEKLEQLRQDRHTTEQRLDAVRTRTRALDLEANEVDLRTESLHEHIARDLGARPEELVGLPEPEAPENTTLPQHAQELERKLTALGPVNPLALEELSQLEERHKELEAQVDDVRGARRELHEVVRTLDHEIMTSFAAAAADVNEHFSTLIAMLFPGGTGRLMLVDPDDLLNTGVEIEVRPAGRNVRRISLLSGGERSMAALAFLFAVFRSRPSPFYMMDEVEAALDDVNLSRFLALVHEFRDEAQLLIVSHQKRTMETGDALYGVTMAPGGSSQVVSQRVDKESDRETASA